MHALIAQASHAPPAALPFWLQVLSISLAPILGFTGVAIGALLTERHQRIAYIGDERRKVYLEYLELLARITAFYSTEFKTALEAGDMRRMAELNPIRRTFLEDVQRIYLQIRLIGSPGVVNTAREVFVYFGLANGISAKAISGDATSEDWGRLIKFGLALQTDFTDAARSDLRLRRKERKLPRIERTESAVSYRKFTLDTVNDLLRSKNAENTSSGDETASQASPEETQTRGDIDPGGVEPATSDGTTTIEDR
jgi:hypothetical protein